MALLFANKKTGFLTSERTQKDMHVWQDRKCKKQQLQFAMQHAEITMR